MSLGFQDPNELSYWQMPEARPRLCDWAQVSVVLGDGDLFQIGSNGGHYTNPYCDVYHDKKVKKQLFVVYSILFVVSFFFFWGGGGVNTSFFNHTLK